MADFESLSQQMASFRASDEAREQFVSVRVHVPSLLPYFAYGNVGYPDQVQKVNGRAQRFEERLRC